MLSLIIARLATLLTIIMFKAAKYGFHSSAMYFWHGLSLLEQNLHNS